MVTGANAASPSSAWTDVSAAISSSARTKVDKPKTTQIENRIDFMMNELGKAPVPSCQAKSCRPLYLVTHVLGLSVTYVLGSQQLLTDANALRVLIGLCGSLAFYFPPHSSSFLRIAFLGGS
jgi:hypothetical protein